MAMSNSKKDLKDTFLWNLTKFSSPHDGDFTEEVVGETPCTPYPSSQIFTTDYGGVTAKWMLSLNADRDRRRTVPETSDECWNFYLELVGTEVKAGRDDDVPPSKRRIAIAPGIKITVNCELIFVEPKTSDNDSDGTGNTEHSLYSIPEKRLKFGSTRAYERLGWPNYTQDRNDPDSNELSPHNQAKEILRHKYKWVNPDDDILHVRVSVKLIEIERTSGNLNANLISDMGRILGSGSASDVIIKCGRNIFPVHKFILCVRSPVFNRMLQGGMKEAKSNEIKIPDIKPFVMTQFLEFLYTAKVDFHVMDQDQIIGLIKAADKYAVIDLKDFCFQYLVHMLDKGTCGRVAATAYLHEAEKHHKNQIYEFIAERWKDLGSEEEFQELVKAYPAAFLRP